MTPQELAALPKGTRVRFDLSPSLDEQVVEEAWGYDYGVITQAGAVCEITWEDRNSFGPSTNIIDTKKIAWERFIADISLDAGPERR